MAFDKNMDIGDLIKGLFSKKESADGAKSAPNPHTKTILGVLLVIIGIAAYIYYVYLPTQEDLRIKNDKIALIESLKYEIEDLSSNIERAQLELKVAQEEYERRTTLFHSDKELEDLYGQISLLAMQNKLTITKIEKGVEQPVFSDGFCFDDNIENMEEMNEFSEGEEELPQLQRVGYYEFVVNLEITGNYTQFTNFRNGLAQLKKIININKELINVPGAESKAGNVNVTTSIATYRLPKNDAEKCVNPDLATSEEEF